MSDPNLERMREEIVRAPVWAPVLGLVLLLVLTGAIWAVAW